MPAITPRYSPLKCGGPATLSNCRCGYPDDRLAFVRHYYLPPGRTCPASSRGVAAGPIWSPVERRSALSGYSDASEPRMPLYDRLGELGCHLSRVRQRNAPLFHSPESGPDATLTRPSSCGACVDTICGTRTARRGSRDALAHASNFGGTSHRVLPRTHDRQSLSRTTLAAISQKNSKPRVGPLRCLAI